MHKLAPQDHPNVPAPSSAEVSHDAAGTIAGPGRLSLVSVGPGYRDLIAPLATEVLRACEVVVGYDLYLRWIAPWIEGKEIHSPPLTQERERAALALAHARAGKRVALVSSGDIGVYAMAALAFEEMREDDEFEVQVVPGITAANACASLLGSPLSHDFATLSLSDLLCPWHWIEDRARHIAQADLAAVLYNVQSRQRPDGVYRILQVMLEHKPANTLCGIVRNAYREEQQVEVVTLAELAQRQFDMLTSIVIGNRFTRRKRHWIYTPRGYGDWDTPEPSQAAQALPAQAVWVFSGTSDGNELARTLVEAGLSVVVSVASAYGAEIARREIPGAAIVEGRVGVERRRQMLINSSARCLVDATHPYAADMSAQLLQLAQELGIATLRFERPAAHCAAPAIHAADAAAAAAQACVLGRRIFLTTGTTTLRSFTGHSAATGRAWFARVTPDPAQLQRALDAGIPRAHVCAMQGPFSQAFNEALWRDLEIDCVVSKESGDAGGYSAKALAAQALGIPLIVIERPRLVFPREFASIATVVTAVRQVLAGAAP